MSLVGGVLSPEGLQLCYPQTYFCEKLNNQDANSHVPFKPMHATANR